MESGLLERQLRSNLAVMMEPAASFGRGGSRSVGRSRGTTLLIQDQLVVAGEAQAVGFPRVLDEDFALPLKKLF